MQRSLIPLLTLILLYVIPAATATADDPPAVATPDKSENASAPVSIFKDKNLEAAVRAEVFAKRFNDDPITADDVANISRVMGKGKGIENLSGLEHCKSVMLIELANNQIVDLQPIAELKRLQSVTLAKNKIADIKPLKGLTSMQLLDLSENQIADLGPLGDMQNLRTLYLANNQVEKLDPITGLRKVWSIDVSGNPIKSLDPIRNFSWLTMLDISKTSVESLEPLSGLKDLDMILMSGSPVTDLKPLVEMCQKDIESERRFAPYLEVYFGKHVNVSKVLIEQIEELRALGVDVYEE